MVVGHIYFKDVFGLLRVVRRLGSAEEEWDIAGEPADLTGHCVQPGVWTHKTQHQCKYVVVRDTRHCWLQ